MSCSSKILRRLPNKKNFLHSYNNMYIFLFTCSTNSYFNEKKQSILTSVEKKSVKSVDMKHKTIQLPLQIKRKNVALFDCLLYLFKFSMCMTMLL